jgi:hypothetical protein
MKILISDSDLNELKIDSFLYAKCAILQEMLQKIRNIPRFCGQVLLNVLSAELQTRNTQHKVIKKLKEISQYYLMQQYKTATRYLKVAADCCSEVNFCRNIHSNSLN